jgi:ATP-dependent RNA helicase DeaD
MESLNKFQELALNPPLLTALDRAGYQTPTPIQAAFIPEALAGRDIIGQAQTGTGKTAAFMLPILQGWREDVQAPQALVLGPTRELVVQIAAEAEKLSFGLPCRSVAIYGGQRMRVQLTQLRHGAQIVIGTPGRLIDHLGRGTLKLDKVRYVVLDEADRMLDIGFRPDIERILRQCPRQRQTFLLSATLSVPVQRLARRYMHEPIMIDVTPEKKTVESVRQCFISVDQHKKYDLLLKVIDREKPRQCIIFCQTKRGADQLYFDLRKVHKRAAVIHGDLQQQQRDRIMAGFRDAKLIYLVATDVMARGIDVTGISHIINYDLPEDSESYVHRIGRTGRMGADGVAVAFATPEEGKKLTAIEMLINHIIEEDRIDGFQAFTPKPIEEKPAAAPALPVFGRRVRRYSRAL